MQSRDAALGAGRDPAQAVNSSCTEGGSGPEVPGRSGFAAHASCEATWSDEVKGMALLYVYRPGRRKAAPSVRQLTSPAQVVFDYDADGGLLGIEVIATVPDAD